MGSTCKFLIIDDDDIDRLITSRMLNSRGITDIIALPSATAGIAWIKEHVNSIGQGLIILVDIMMPGMDGFQFMEAFDALDSSMKKITRVFMLSSTLDPRDINRVKNNKTITELLSKPLSMNKLTSLVDQTPAILENR
ncbi:MAG: response regulator [Chryseolinea sp.]